MPFMKNLKTSKRKIKSEFEEFEEFDQILQGDTEGTTSHMSSQLPPRCSLKAFLLCIHGQ